MRNPVPSPSSNFYCYLSSSPWMLRAKLGLEYCFTRFRFWFLSSFTWFCNVSIWFSKLACLSESWFWDYWPLFYWGWMLHTWWWYVFLNRVCSFHQFWRNKCMKYPQNQPNVALLYNGTSSVWDGHSCRWHPSSLVRWLCFWMWFTIWLSHDLRLWNKSVWLKRQASYYLLSIYR